MDGGIHAGGAGGGAIGGGGGGGGGGDGYNGFNNAALLAKLRKELQEKKVRDIYSGLIENAKCVLTCFCLLIYRTKRWNCDARWPSRRWSTRLSRGRNRGREGAGMPEAVFTQSVLFTF